MLTLPEIPWLRSGAGKTPGDGGCIMQIIDWINRNEWTDEPPCVHPVFRRVAIRLNDSLGDDERQKLLDLAPRMMNTANSDKVLSVRLAVFSARSVLHIFEERYPEDKRARRAIEAAEAWLDDPTAYAAYAAYAADAAYAAYAANAAYAAYAANAAAAYAAYAAYAAADAYAAYAVYAAAYAANATSSGLHFLVSLLDEYDRITERDTNHQEIDYAPVCAVMKEEALA